VGEVRNAYKLLVRKSEEKRPLGIPQRRWEDNIKMSLRKVGCKLWTGCIWLRKGAVDGLL
jgi:hypothetical protein